MGNLPAKSRAWQIQTILFSFPGRAVCPQTSAVPGVQLPLQVPCAFQVWKALCPWWAEAPSLTVVLYISGSFPGPGTPFCSFLIKNLQRSREDVWGAESSRVNSGRLFPDAFFVLSFCELGCLLGSRFWSQEEHFIQPLLLAIMRINDTIMKSYYTLFDEGLSSERFRSALKGYWTQKSFYSPGKFRQCRNGMWGTIGKHTLSIRDSSVGGAKILDSNKIAAYI